MNRYLPSLVALMLLFVACESPPAPPPPDGGMRMPSPEWARGTWVVARHLIPGISAMTDAEAASWHGRSLTLTDTMAAGPDATCESPSYRESLVQSDSIRWSYRLAPGALPLRQPASTVLDVFCDGTSWTAFGSALIAIHPDTVLASWDGVFFVLGRR